MMLACAVLFFVTSRAFIVGAYVVPADDEPVVQAVDESDFKVFTTSHPKFLALMHSPWDVICQKAVREFTKAAQESQRILQERGDAKIVFVTVRSVQQCSA
jgi:hypothetical protein